MIDKLMVLVAVCAAESVSTTLTDAGPVAVGMPVIKPLDLLMVKLAGSPDAVNVYGGAPRDP